MIDIHQKDYRQAVVTVALRHWRAERDGPAGNADVLRRCVPVGTVVVVRRDLTARGGAGMNTGRCRSCGAEVLSGDEGTSFYRPVRESMRIEKGGDHVARNSGRWDVRTCCIQEGWIAKIAVIAGQGVMAG